MLIVLIDNNGNEWVENNYDGYGVFGGMDISKLTDKMNGGDGCVNRGHSILFNYSDLNDDEINYPNLIETRNWTYKNDKIQLCKYNGEFNPNELCDDECDVEINFNKNWLKIDNWVKDGRFYIK